MDALRALADRLAAPPVLYTAALLLFLAAARWRPLRRAAGLAVAFSALTFGIVDAGFRRLLLDPERLPVTAFAILSFGLLGSAMGRRPATEPGPWRGPSPAELAAVVGAGLLVMVVAFLVEPPLATPYLADLPNPAKDPWFLAGLQEMRFYFDPWVTSYLVPGLLLAALVALPYLDPEPTARGPGIAPAPALFRLGWLFLGILPILIAVYLRGPHWNAFGPFEAWDAARPPPLPADPLSRVFWCRWLGRDVPPAGWAVRELPALLFLGGYFLIPLSGLHRWRGTRGLFERYRQAIGPRLYALALLLALALAVVPLKMYCRWIFGVGDWLHLPELELSF